MALDGTIEDETIRFLAAMSYELAKNEEVGDHFLISLINYLS